MYLVDVAIGKAGQVFRLLVDTGSPLVIVPGAACHKRAHQFDTASAQPRNRSISVKYGLGSVSGHVFQDRICIKAPGGASPLQEVGFLQERQFARKASTAQVGDDSSEQACADTAFLVIDEESDDLAAQPFDGILGLGLESSSENQGGMGRDAGFSILSQLAAIGAIHNTVFALRLGSSGTSQLLLGGVDDATLAGGRILWVPLSPAEDGNWQFYMQDFTLGGVAQNFGSLQVAVDSGTSLLAADQEVGEWLRSRLTPSSCDAVDQMPKLGLKLGDSELLMLPADYVDRADGACKLALMPSAEQAGSGQRLVLGDSFLRRYVAVFDRPGQRLGFGVAADDRLAGELLPAMFPAPTTTTAAPTTAGPPPPEHLDYEKDKFLPSTTPAPLTPEEVEAVQQQSALTDAFSGMGDDLAASFEHTISQEKSELKSTQMLKERPIAQQ